MKIGLDFDGVISDCGKLKSENAKRFYNIDIPPRSFKREFVVNHGILTSEQYDLLLDKIYGTRQIGLNMEPVEGALEFLPILKKENDELVIITSRKEGGTKIAREWMQRYGLDIKLIGIGGSVSKAQACNGLDVYVDDDLNKLEPLIGIVPYRFLFSQDYNTDVFVPENIATRIKSWSHLYEEISKIKKRK